MGYFSMKSNEVLATKSFAVFLITLSGSNVKFISKLLILRTFFGPYHSQLLPLLNESMELIAYAKSHESERISYTAHSVNCRKDGYNLTFSFFNTSFYSKHSIFNVYIFMTQKKGLDQILPDATNNFIIHHSQVFQQKSGDLHYFLSNIATAN